MIKRGGILREIKSIINDDLKKVKHIKGLGVRYLSGILAYAHPSRFSNLHKFLHYCGYKGSAKITKKYSRKVCSLIHEVAKSLIKQKDPKYYPLYKKIRKELERKHPTYPKGRIYNMSLNRTATFLLKEIYQIFGTRGNSVSLPGGFPAHRQSCGKVNLPSHKGRLERLLTALTSHLEKGKPAPAAPQKRVHAYHAVVVT